MTQHDPSLTAPFWRGFAPTISRLVHPEALPEGDQQAARALDTAAREFENLWYLQAGLDAVEAPEDQGYLGRAEAFAARIERMEGADPRHPVFAVEVQGVQVQVERLKDQGPVVLVAQGSLGPLVAHHQWGVERWFLGQCGEA